MHVAGQIARPVSTHLSTRREERPTQSHNRAGLALQASQEHFVPDVAAFAGRLALGVDRVVDAAHAPHGRVVKVLDDRRHRVRRERGSDVGEDEDVAGRDLHRTSLGILFSPASGSPDQDDALFLECPRNRVGGVHRAVRRDDDLQPVSWIFEAQRVLDLPLDPRLLIVGRDDERHRRRHVCPVDPSLANRRHDTEQYRVQDICVGDEDHRRPECDFQHQRSIASRSVTASIPLSRAKLRNRRTFSQSRCSSSWVRTNGVRPARREGE